MIEEKYVESIDGVRARYLELGSGRLLVIISGWMGTADNAIPLIERLSDSFHCFAFDLPGFGLSSPFTNLVHTVENYAEFLDDVIKRIGLKDFAWESLWAPQ